LAGIVVAMLMRHQPLRVGRRPWRVAGRAASILSRVGAAIEARLAAKVDGVPQRIFPARTRA
jgi:hypothetical protein